MNISSSFFVTPDLIRGPASFFDGEEEARPRLGGRGDEQGVSGLSLNFQFQ
jgi:hypothetical protein